jgi:hypothetical protein
MCQPGKEASCRGNFALWEEGVYFAAQSLREVAQEMHDKKSGLVFWNARLLPSLGLARTKGILVFKRTTSSKAAFVENQLIPPRVFLATPFITAPRSVRANFIGMEAVPLEEEAHVAWAKSVVATILILLIELLLFTLWKISGHFGPVWIVRIELCTSI